MIIISGVTITPNPVNAKASFLLSVKIDEISEDVLNYEYSGTFESGEEVI